MFIAFGVAFEVPVAVVVLTRLGVLTVDQLREFRRYFWVAAAAAAGLVTPPDAVSMVALLVPMGLLYEVGIVASQFFLKHTKAPDADAKTETAPPATGP
jgi:sec-independent protein translocase protein TatC